MKTNVYDHVKQYMTSWRKVKKEHPGLLVLILGLDGCYHTIEQDAERVSEICGTYLESIPRLTCTDRHTMFQQNQLDSHLVKLIMAGERVGICKSKQIQEIVTPNKNHE